MPSRAGRCIGFLKCRVEIPTPLARGEAPARGEFLGRRKEGRKHASRPDFFSWRSHGLWEPCPTLLLAPWPPSPTSRAETLIIREEFLLGQQHTGHATCNLQIMVITESVFPAHSPCGEGIRADWGEADLVGTQVRSLLLAGRIWEVSRPLHLPHLQRGGSKCIYHARSLRGSRELIEALSTCVILMLHQYPVYSTYCSRKFLHIVIHTMEKKTLPLASFE